MPWGLNREPTWSAPEYMACSGMVALLLAVQISDLGGVDIRTRREFTVWGSASVALSINGRELSVLTP